MNKYKNWFPLKSNLHNKEQKRKRNLEQQDEYYYFLQHKFGIRLSAKNPSKYLAL